MVSNLKQELIALCAKHTPQEGENTTPIDGLSLFKARSIDDPLPTVYSPCLCFIVQGRKQVMLGDEIYSYQSGQYLAVPVDVPMINLITQATPQAPYLLIKVDLQAALLTELLEKMAPLEATELKPTCSVFKSYTDAQMQDILLRLVTLIDTPRDIKVLAHQTLRELVYRVLCADGGAQIASLSQKGSVAGRIALVIRQIQGHFSQHLPIEELAQLAGMSISTFHVHFKTITAMSPRQYQKSLRLIEARRLMLSEGRNVATSAWEVGYESSSQFSREYARMFGAPPARDINRLRRSVN